MGNKRKVAIFTGNRAEYGLLYSLIKGIRDENELTLQLIVTGGHLDPKFGNTLSEIETDGFQISRLLKLTYRNNSNQEIPTAIADCISKTAEALDDLRPDLLVVYADRFEGFAAVIAASQMNIPVAHIEGGDLTEGGALDDSIRHAMTKLSHIHFTTNAEAKKRVLSLGEEPWRVHNVGFPGIDGLQNQDFTDPEALIRDLQIDPTKPLILFTLHSITTEPERAREQIKECIAALREKLADNIQCIITYPNNDRGSVDIINEIRKFEGEGHENLTIVPSLGRRNYHGVLNLSLLDLVNVICVGNSSSGLKETPFFNCPAVNIGDRQKGRLRSGNVLTCECKQYDIKNAIEMALALKNTQTNFTSQNPYGSGNSATKMINVISKIEINDQLIKKKMTF